MKSPSPAFQFYPKDFLSDSHVVMMSAEARGAYITLMCYCWLDGSLPAEPSSLALMSGLPVDRFSNTIWPLLSVCFRAKGLRLIHPRLDRERKKQREHKLRQSEGGRLGAARRWDSDGLPIGDPMGSDSSSSSSSSPSSKKKIKIVSSEPPSAPSEPAVLTFPVVGSANGHDWPLTQSQIDAWATLYPGVDVLASCRQALAWALANTTKRKTATGMPRFLVGWLTRDQNRSHTGSPAVDARKVAEMKRYMEAQKR